MITWTSAEIMKQQPDTPVRFGLAIVPGAGLIDYRVVFGAETFGFRLTLEESKGLRSCIDQAMAQMIL